MSRKNLFVGLAVFAMSGAATFGQAFSIPTSDKVVELHLILPDGKIAKVQAREGTMVTIHDGTSGTTQGFVPKLEDNDKTLSILVLQIFDQGAGRSNVKQFGYMKGLIFGSSAEVDMPAGKFEMEPRSVGMGSFPHARPVDPSQPLTNPGQLRKVYSSGSGDCCVRCYSITICATSVDLDCGACSSGGALYQ
jgi:hypothetical protein